MRQAEAVAMAWIVKGCKKYSGDRLRIVAVGDLTAATIDCQAKGGIKVKLNFSPTIPSLRRGSKCASRIAPRPS
jgi:hypothetical protein